MRCSRKHQATPLRAAPWKWNERVAKHLRIGRRFLEESILKREQVRHPGFPVGLGNLAVGREGQRGGDDPQRHPHADLERRAELQPGVFTQDIGRIMQVCEEIEAR